MLSVHELSRLAVHVVLLGICVGLFACSGGGNGEDLLAEIERPGLTDGMRELVQRQHEDLSELTETPASDDIQVYFGLMQDLLMPERQIAAEDTFWSIWEEDPGRFMWVEFARIRGRKLTNRDRLEVAMERATADTGGLPSVYMRTRSGWSRRPEARAEFLSLQHRLTSLKPLDRMWAERSFAMVERMAGDLEAAEQRLIRTLPEASRVGGASLAACWWSDLAKILRHAERFADAHAAALMERECGRISGNAIFEIRGLLSTTRALSAQGEYGEAQISAVDAEELARLGGHRRWLISSQRLHSQVLRNSGDRQSYLAVQRDLYQTAQSDRDTVLAIRTALSTANTHRLLGAADSSQAWLDRASRLNDAGSPQGWEDRIGTIQLSLLIHEGFYVAADSLRQSLKAALSNEQACAVLLEQIEQGLNTGRPDVVYRGLAEVQADPDLLDHDGSYDPVLDLALLSARFHARQGEYERAATALVTAGRRVERGATAFARYDHVCCVGRVAEIAGDHEAAIDAYRQALEMVVDLEIANEATRCRVLLGEAYLDTRQFVEARALFAQSDDFVGHWPQVARHLFLGCIESAADNHQAALDHLGQAEDLMRADAPAELQMRLQLEKGRSLAELGRVEAAMDALRAIETETAANPTAEELEVVRAFHRPLSLETAEARIGLWYDEPQLAGDRPLALITLLEALQTRWRLDPTGPLPSLADLQALSPTDGSPVLACFLGRHRVFGWIGTRDGWQIFEIPDRDVLLDLVLAVRTDMEAPERPVQWDDARELGRLLLGNVYPAWTRGHTLSILVPGELSGLPWSALPVGHGPDGLRLALDHGPIVHLAGLDQSPRPTDPTRRERSTMLAVGVDASGLDPRLQRAEAEARSVGALWGENRSTVVTGDSGNWDNLQQQGLPGFDIIHIASHAAVTEGLPGCSTLRLAGSDQSLPLTIPELAKLELNAELVFLSCCEGGRSARDSGAGVDSFSKAFLAAGSRTVVASTRVVQDDAALALAQAFYRPEGTKRNWAACLQAAQLSLRDDSGSWRHPFFWSYYQIHRNGLDAD